jgi:chain length determinant protein (polysaccharide antigen chain regulator)
MDPQVDPLNPNQISPIARDEIDLFDLFELLWRERLIIVAITAFAALLGGLVAVTLQPTYRASTLLKPPVMSDISELRKFNFVMVHLPGNPSKPKQEELRALVFSQFFGILTSSEIKQAFLRDEELSTALFKEPVSLEKKLKALDNLVVIKKDKDKGPLTGIELTFDARDPTLATNAATKFVALAIEAFRERTSKDYFSVRDQVVEVLQADIARSLALHENRIDVRLSKLYDALAIAKTLRIKEPVYRAADHLVEQEFFSTPFLGELPALYFRGSDALDAEIDIVERHRKDIKLSPEYVEILEKLKEIKKLNFDSSKVMPLTIDLVASPEHFDKPKRSLIIALSAGFGGMLAVMFVLIRNWVRSRKRSS